MLQIIDSLNLQGKARSVVCFKIPVFWFIYTEP